MQQYIVLHPGRDVRHGVLVLLGAAAQQDVPVPDRRDLPEAPGLRLAAAQGGGRALQPHARHHDLERRADPRRARHLRPDRRQHGDRAGPAADPDRDLRGPDHRRAARGLGRVPGHGRADDRGRRADRRDGRDAQQDRRLLRRRGRRRGRRADRAARAAHDGVPRRHGRRPARWRCTCRSSSSPRTSSSRWVDDPAVRCASGRSRREPARRTLVRITARAPRARDRARSRSRACSSASGRQGAERGGAALYGGARGGLPARPRSSRRRCRFVRRLGRFGALAARRRRRAGDGASSTSRAARTASSASSTCRSPCTARSSSSGAAPTAPRCSRRPATGCALWTAEQTGTRALFGGPLPGTPLSALWVVHTVALLLVALLGTALARELRIAGERLEESASSLRELRDLHERTVESLTSGLLTTDLDGLRHLVQPRGRAHHAVAPRGR